MIAINPRRTLRRRFTTCNATNHPNASRGRLCEMVDQVDGPTGLFTVATTQYQWEAFGRLTRQTQILSSAIANHSTTRSTAFTYRTSGGGKGDLATLTYPSGAILTHQYNASGRLSGMLWNGQPLIENFQFNALGQPLSWTWAFGNANTVTSLNATRLYNTARQLTSSEFATFAPETTGRIGSVMQKLMKSNGAGGWVSEDVPFNATYNSLGQLTSFTAVCTSPVFQWGHTYSYDANANSTGGTITANGASMSLTSALSRNRLTNAAGDTTSLLCKTLAYDAAGRLNTPRRLTDGTKAVKRQWPYSGFGEIAPQSTPAAGQAPLNYSLRYPGQIDDGNGLFYNWHRFYDLRVGRYTQADPIGLDGGWNRFGYVGGNPLGFVDPEGLSPNSGEGFSKLPILPPGPLNRLPGDPGYQLPLKPAPQLLIPKSCMARCNLLVGMICGPVTAASGATGQGLFAVGYTFAGCRAAVFGGCNAGCGDEPQSCPAGAP